MSNQWFRMYAEFANDPKVQMMDEALQRRLIMLFCFRCNSDVTLHDEEVTFQLRISAEEWQRTKAVFVAKGFIDDDNNILNWDKRQYRSDSSAERVRKHRNSKKQQPVTTCNVTVTPPEAEQSRYRTDTDTESINSSVAYNNFARCDAESGFVGFISAFDKTLIEVFGNEAARLYPSASDGTYARQFEEAKVDLGWCTDYFRHRFGVMKSEGRQPPRSLKYFQKAVPEAYASHRRDQSFNPSVKSAEAIDDAFERVRKKLYQQEDQNVQSA